MKRNRAEGVAFEPREQTFDEGGLSHHYVTIGQGAPLVLIHGFPQNWKAWRPVMERVAHRFRIIAPNLRGLGGSPGPCIGYDKHALAEDIRTIVNRECGERPAIVCGHDLGAHVAFAYGLQNRTAVRGLVLVGPPPPGTRAAADLIRNPRTWHLNFHAEADLAHMLIHGRERAYFEYFIRSRLEDGAAITSAEIDDYASTYAAPGALRSALEMYRSLAIDRELNLAALAAEGRLSIPVVMVAAASRSTAASVSEVLEQITTTGRAVMVEECGHWIPQEKPDCLAAAICDLATDYPTT